MIQLAARFFLRLLPPVRASAAAPRPAPTPLLDGELTTLQVVSLPETVILLGAGRNRGLYAELTVAQAVRLRCDLDDALLGALQSRPTARERQVLVGGLPRKRPGETA